MKIESERLNQLLKAAKEYERYFTINQRKYLGNKTNLMNNFIDKAIREKIKLTNLIDNESISFLDLFSGTGSVSHYVKNEFNFNVFLNDYLYHNYLISKTFFNINTEESFIQLIELIEELNNLAGVDGYCTEHWSDKYFSKENCRKIDAIREKIDEYKNLSIEVKAGAITSLLYGIDKVANTAGIYTKWILSEKPTTKPLELKIPIIDIDNNKIKDHKVSSLLAEELIEDTNLNYNILYLDPPYFERSYYEFYHVLENISRWEKPELFYSSLREKWPSRCRTGFKGIDRTKESFEKILKNAEMNVNCRMILMSYSNSGVLSERYILKIMKQFGKTYCRRRTTTKYDTGRGNNRENYKELLFISIR